MGTVAYLLVCESTYFDELVCEDTGTFVRLRAKQ